MIVTGDIVELRKSIAAEKAQGRRIGCVPTMGALHAGHMSLVEEATRESDFVVVTIFVNPTQFAPTEDLSQYPRPLDDDLAMCRDADVDLVFTPDVSSLYPDGFETCVEVEHLSTLWEGAHRPGHFRGVTTIVLKLFNLVQPDMAVFGQKDYQQQAIIRRMVRDLDVPVDIITGPTIRESDGLAMSSRNVYLSVDERTSACTIHQCLKLAKKIIGEGETDLTHVRAAMFGQLVLTDSVVPEYLTIADADTLEELTAPRDRMIALVAARVGTTRLIDNLLISIDNVRL